MAYGLTVKLLQDVLPIDEPLRAVTIRNHVLLVAQRLEDTLGDEVLGTLGAFTSALLLAWRAR